ncbi:hypothetical protein LCGC14_0393330 [marine sediment metagenome]|uniref:Type IV secretion system protein VirB10 n=3 Tax=root TaxID=1 RepID=A0A7V1BLR3_9GAMM|nr:TrbI/VirB10 family protein [Marinobacter antarcticus]HDZ55288.1 hypothetical protein [Halopseudomonas xinjiangensis]HEA51676.1 hypothetical protein [Marinobacter antarcticus]
MAEEAAPRIEEKPAIYKKKLQVWLMVAFGSVMALLLILTLINIFSKLNGSKPRPPEIAREQRSAPTIDRQDQFDQLVSNRRPRVTPMEAIEVEGMTAATAPSANGKGTKSEEAPAAPQLSQEEKALAQWQARERLRALNSAQAGWELEGSSGSKKEQPAEGRPTVAAASSSRPARPGPNDMMSQLDALNRPLSETGSLEERRAEVRKRIEEAQRLRGTLATQGASGLPNAAGRTAATPEQQELKTIKTSFHQAPENVAGYSKENRYNADIAGKIKMPPGTEIPTTLMRKAISDYTGGSLKAIVSHDVYDVSREFVLIPKGTEVNIGIVRTRNVNEAISSRVAFIVKDAVLPDTRVIDFSTASAVDREGVGAIEDQVDHHFMAQFFGVAAYALVSNESSYAGTGLEQGSYTGDVSAGLRSELSPLAQKYLNIVPTSTIRPGQSFRVIVEEEMYIEPWSHLYAQYME